MAKKAAKNSAAQKPGKLTQAQKAKAAADAKQVIARNKRRVTITLLTMCSKPAWFCQGRKLRRYGSGAHRSPKPGLKSTAPAKPGLLA